MSKEKLRVPITSQKLTQKKKKCHEITKQSIRKMCSRLCSESSVIKIDDSNNTIVNEDSMIIIPDDEDEGKSSMTITPRKNMYCLPFHSTPTKCSPSVNELIPKNSINNTIKPIKSANNIKQHSNSIIDIQCSDTSDNNILNCNITLTSDIANSTKEINQDSYLTIDLTADSSIRTQNQTVVDLDSVVENGEMFSHSNTSTMSGDSDVTVINLNNNNSKKKEMLRIADGIDKLNASDKGKLLQIITQKIFNGCNMVPELKASLGNIGNKITKATETEEDVYIKQVILKKSRNSIGSNIYHPEKPIIRSPLRMIVIDGSNVAMEHGRGKFFSVKGLKICIDYFLNRGHVVKAFVPRFRCKYGKSSDPRLLDRLERQGQVVYTPSREIKGKTITPYDDRYIIQCAAEFDGVIVTGDNYRDLIDENPRWRYIIENRLLPFTWVQDMIMFPRDPMGRNGPSLEVFLKNPNIPS